MRCVVLLLVASLVTASKAQYSQFTGYQNNFGGANYAGLAAYAGFGGQGYGYGGQGYGHGGQGYGHGGQGFAFGFFPGKIPFGISGLYGHPTTSAPKVKLFGSKSTGTGTMLESLNVVIREKMRTSPYQFWGDFNGHSGNGKNDLDPGLEMEVTITSNMITSTMTAPLTKVFIAITEFDGSTSTPMCTAESSGPVITPRNDDNGHHGGFPIDAAFAAHSLSAGYGGGASQSPVALSDAVVAEIMLMPGQLTKINIDSLNSINKLSEVAGRGVIACTELKKNALGKLVCTGQILSCVGLTYMMIPMMK